MEDDIPIEEQVFTPNPLLIADLIFESPKPPKATTATMNYTRHPSTDGGPPHVHFEDGKTTTMKPHHPSPPRQYPQQPQAAYPLPQNQSQQPGFYPPQQQAPYFPPPPPQSGSAPVPIPIRSRARSNSHDAYPVYPPGPYGGSPNTAAMPLPPQTAYGTWPHPGYYPPTMSPQTEFPWQAQPGAGSYLPGPGPMPPPAAAAAGQQQVPGGYYPPPPPAPLQSIMKPRTDSTSSYASRSSHRYEESPDKSAPRRHSYNGPLYESDEDSSGEDSERRRRKHHHHRHHHGAGSRKSSYSSHGDRGEGKYSGHSDHASLADTLVLIWDGISGGFGKPKRY